MLLLAWERVVISLAPTIAGFFFETFCHGKTDSLKMITKEAFESSQYEEMKNVDQDGWPKCLMLSTYSVLTYHSMLHRDVQLLCQYFMVTCSSLYIHL